VGGQKKSSRSSSGSASRTSIASYQRQLREADRQGGIERIRDVESALISLHKKPFPPARRPKAPEPEPVDMKSIHRRARKEELSSVSPFRFSKRRTAKRRADEKAIRDIAEEKGKRLATTKQQQVELDREWSDLIDNQPETVMAALETAFEDNQDPAAPVDSEGSRASIVILYPPQDFMPDKKPALTPTGRPTLKRRNKTETSDLYARAVASTVLATLKEDLAVAPRVEQITTIVARKESRADDPQAYWQPSMQGHFHEIASKDSTGSTLTPSRRSISLPTQCSRGGGRQQLLLLSIYAKSRETQRTPRGEGVRGSKSIRPRAAARTVVKMKAFRDFSQVGRKRTANALDPGR
jgi:gas vesicle protein